MNCYVDYLTALRDTNKFRSLRPKNNQEHTDVLNFSSNDYLNLSHHPDLIEAARRAGLRFGVGSTGSRLLSGNNFLFDEFEAQIAFRKNTEKALIFSSGYQANSSALATLCDKKVLKEQALLFFDKLNHASLYHAAFLSGAKLIRYKHNDMNDLNRLLEIHQEDSGKRFIVTESLFGMDGDTSPLEDLVCLTKKYNAFLYLDEAHAGGVYGTDGYGLSTTVDLSSIPHLIMGTFSKALGSCGAYVASSSLIIEYLINACPGFIFSTAPSPMAVGASQCAWIMLPSLDRERTHLQETASYLRKLLSEAHFNIGTSSTHIIPIILESEESALQVKQSLEKRNIIVSAVRPPSVPTSRIRIALSSIHTKTDVETLYEAFLLSIQQNS